MSPKSKKIKLTTDVNEKNPEGQTLLNLAAISNNVKEVKLLLSHGADVNLSDKSKKTPLHYVTTHNQEKSHLLVMKQLLESGADVNAKNKYGQTPLHCLAKGTDIEVVQLMFESGADLNVKDKQGYFPPLYTAGNTEVVRLLLKFGFKLNNVDSFRRTLLHFAAKHNVSNTHFETIELLLNSGADVNARDKEGLTPLHHLILSPASVETVELFLKFKANLKIKSERFFSYGSVEINSVEVFQLLVDHGLEVKHTRNSVILQSPLHKACERNVDDRVIKFLVKNGANTDDQDYMNYTPLMRYVHYCPSINDETIEYLLKYSDVNRMVVPAELIFLNKSRWCSSYKIIVKHVAKMKALDLKVQSTNLDEILESKKGSNYFKKCTEELEVLKITKLENSWLTFFNLLVDSKRKLKNYGGNEEFIQNFKKSNCKSKFPIYGDSIKKNVKKALERRKAFDESSIAFSKLLPIFNPNHMIVRDILDCLSSSSCYRRLVS